MAQELQFKKVTTLPEKGKYSAGTIYFNSTTHSIFVAKTTETTDEFGGRIKDVTYADQKLTIEKYTDSGTLKYELNFNDVASADDISKALSAITSRLNTLEGIINDTRDTEGNVTKKGLSSRVDAVEGEVDSLQTSVNSLNNDVYGYTDKNGTEVKGLKTIVNETVEAVASKANDTGDGSKNFNVKDPTENSHAANKKYVDTLVSSAYRVVGCIDDLTALKAIQKPKNGDVYNVKNSITIGDDDVTNSNFIEASKGFYPAGTNWVWVEHTNDTPHKSHWDALGGTIDLSGYATTNTIADVAGRVTKLENGENTVKTFGGKYGDILIDTAPSKDGQITFAIDANNKLSGSVKGIAAAAYKDVDTSMTESSTSVNLPTTVAVVTALTKLHGAIVDEMKSNTVMAWAEWPTS